MRLMYSSVIFPFTIICFIFVVNSFEKLEYLYTMQPKVFVFSEGSLSTKEVIESIITANGENFNRSNVTNMADNLIGFECNLKTKYYENSIVLIPIQMEIGQVSSADVDNIEAIIVYVDLQNNNFKQQMCIYKEFMTNHGIKNGLVILNNAENDSEIGISYEDIKILSNLALDIVELNQNNENTCENLCGFEEVLQTLYSYKWSDIKQGSKQTSHFEYKSGSDQNAVDIQLEAFESLLIKIQEFKSATSSMEREDVLDQAEILATQFVQLLSTDDNL